ncbi:Glycosyltransferase 61 catalytic domain-containing protein [Plasmodiophora brassicae]
MRGARVAGAKFVAVLAAACLTWVVMLASSVVVPFVQQQRWANRFSDCDATLGWGLLRTWKSLAPSNICMPGGESSAIAKTVHGILYPTTTESHLEFYNVSLDTQSLLSDKATNLDLACNIGGLSNEQVLVPDEFLTLKRKPTRMLSQQCDGRWHERPILLAVRHEFWNLYHSLESLIGAFQAVHIADLDPSTVDVIIADGSLKARRPGIDELWKAVFPRLVPMKTLVDINTTLCARRAVLGMTGRHGSILVHTWYPFSPCARSPGNLLLQDFSLRILRHFQLVDYRPPASGPFIVTFIARRPDANFTFGGRTMSMETESEILDVINDTPPVNGRPFHAAAVEFTALSISDQVRTARGSHVLIGTHGAGLSHVLWLAEGAGLVELKTEIVLPFRSVQHVFHNMAVWSRRPYRHVSYLSSQYDIDRRELQDAIRHVVIEGMHRTVDVGSDIAAVTRVRQMQHRRSACSFWGHCPSGSPAMRAQDAAALALMAFACLLFLVVMTSDVVVPFVRQQRWVNQFTNCDASLGWGFLRTWTGTAPFDICTPGGMSSATAKTMHGVMNPTTTESHLEFYNVGLDIESLLSRSPTTLELSCDITEFNNDQALVPAEFLTLKSLPATTLAEKCSGRWHKRPILLAARHEYWNLYHSMESLLGAFQAILIAGLDPSGVDVIVADGSVTKKRPEIDTFWGAIFPNIVPVEALQAADGTVCARQAILGMSGRHGSILVNTWYPFSPCTQSPGNLLLQDFSQRIVGHFQLADHQPPTSGPFIITFIARRPKSSYGGRAMSVDQESEIVDIINDMPPIDGRTIQATSLDFASMSTIEQVRQARGSHVLVGTHGAGLTHVLWLAEGAGLVELKTEVVLPIRSVQHVYHNMAMWIQRPYRRVSYLSGQYDVDRRELQRAIRQVLVEGLQIRSQS